MLIFASVAAGSAQASSAYVIQQRAANSTSQLILAPSGLRFDYFQPVRKGGRLRARRPTPLVGLIIRYRDGRLILLDPVHHTYQVLALRSAISSYESELSVLQRAQPSVKLPPRPGSKPRNGQAPLTPPRAQLKRLGMSIRIGPVRAQAYLLRQGRLLERLWYASALPAPPAPIQSLLAQALGNSGSGPLGRALRAHAAQIPLRIDERSGRRWRTVLKTLSIKRQTLGGRALQPPRGYRKAKLLAVPKINAHRASTPARPIRCGALVLVVNPLLGCTSLGAELTGLAGPLSEHPAIWAFYWGSGFADHLDYVSAINHGLENMVGDQFADPSAIDFYGPLSQYGVFHGRLLGSQVITGDNPDSSIGSWNFFDVQWFILTHRWGSDAPHYWWRWSDQDPIFAIFVDSSKVDSGSWYGYHFFAPTEGIFFAFLVHVAMPYFIVKVPPLDQISNQHDTPQWHQAVDTATERASHEFVEAATDPYPFTSWADPLKEPIWEEGEIADICQQGNHSPWGTATRVAQYGTAFEPYWSNDAGACVPDARPTAQIVSPANGASYPWDSSVEFHVVTNDLFDNGPAPNVTWYDNGTEMAAGSGHDFFRTRSLSPGTHSITVRAEDSVGGVRTAGPVTINVVAHPPTVTIDKPANGATFGSDQTINFVGTATDAGQGDLGPSATWSVDGTPVGTGASLFQYRISTEGAHTVTLSATNGIGLTSSASITVNIGPPAGKPSVSITQPNDGYQAGSQTQITFSAAATPSSGETITGYTWNFGDGATGTGQTVTHNYVLNCNGPVPYNVTVTATQSNGQTASDSITIYEGVNAC